MIGFKRIIGSIAIVVMLSSCEEVIQIDLNEADPAFVAEAIIYKDSVAVVRLTRTTSYFSVEEPDVIGNAVLEISNGIATEDLTYTGDGYYTGTSITGTEGATYELQITHEGKTYTGISTMPVQPEIISIDYSKSNEVTIFNPDGETMYIIDIEFLDDPDISNYYMVHFILDGKILGNSLYVMTEEEACNGELEIRNINKADADTVLFSEWMFYEGGEAEVQVFSIDESVYNYFLQLNDVLYWKRRYMPPTPYNPVSNLNNGALGYFAAWAYDSRRILLE